MKIATSGKKNGGLAKIEVNSSKPVVRVTVKGEEGQPNKVYIVQKENCPPYVMNGTFYARLNADGTKLFSLVPVQGVVDLKFKEFYHEAEKDPAPTTRTGAGKNGPYTYQTFMAIFEITSGEFQGMTVPGYFSYNFQAARMGEKTYAEISHPASAFTKKLIEFLEVTGLIKEDIPWRENLLPMFQKYIAHKDPKFSGLIKEGRIEALYTDVNSKF